jgi:hypothetical protein
MLQRGSALPLVASPVLELAAELAVACFRAPPLLVGLKERRSCSALSSAGCGGGENHSRPYPTEVPPKPLHPLLVANLGGWGVGFAEV